MAQPMLKNVSLPLNAHINGMFPGRVITVSGMVHSNAKSFSISLLTGDGGDADYAFHFNPRFEEGNIVVRNSKVNGEWEDEERETPKFQFRHGESFEVVIRCQENKYKIEVNGKHFARFKHRIPFYKVSHLNIVGEIDANVVSFGMESQVPSAISIIKEPRPDAMLDIPFRNLKHHSVSIIGKMDPQASSFEVNFYNEEGQIVFHLNPRFDEQAVVRNAKLDGWGSEERDNPDGFPFAMNVPFEIKIEVDKKGFHVKLNGFPLYNFQHRFRPIRKVKSIQITQGANIREVMFY